MIKSMPWRTIVAIWLCWAVLTIGYQTVVKMRITDLERPDLALQWTQTCTFKDSQDQQPYLIDPFMNEQVCWDSEFYLSIATAGYDDPLVRSTPVKDVPAARLSLNYAFFPLYPLIMRFFYMPLRFFGLASIPAATLAGVIISLLGTLLAMFALFDLARGQGQNDDTALRAVWYLLIFPMGFFLVMVYTEGLFVGLVFMTLALIRRRCWWGAGLLAALATLARPVGGLLMVPLAWAWWQDHALKDLASSGKERWQALAKAAAVLLPGGMFLLWKFSYQGWAFDAVQTAFFGRRLFDVIGSLHQWNRAWQSMWLGNPATTVYYAIEFGALVLALTACIWMWKYQRAEAIFGALLVLVAFLSGVPQGMPRYVMGVPAIYLMLASMGKNKVFDRAWSMASLLLFALHSLLFAFDFWVN